MSPTKPPTCCRKLGCPGVRGPDGCTVCGDGKKKSGWSDRRRGSRHQRGYDSKWVVRRTEKLAADPLCELCKTEGYDEVAEEVHHKVPFKGKGDPLRLAWDNLESVCGVCHRKVTGGR